MFTAGWTEKDEAILLDLLHRKVGELKFDIRDANSPYVKARLRAKRKEYKALIMKVSHGEYDSNILAAELAAAKSYNRAKVVKQNLATGKYADSYSDVDFDFAGYFHKTRYFGTSLPIIMILLMVVFLFVTLCGTFLPQDTIYTVENGNTSWNGLNSGDTRISVASVGYFKLGADDNDLNVPNDGNWPKAVYSNPSKALAQGELYQSSDGTYPERVYLYKDLGIVAIEITNADVIKALFRTPLFSQKRLDPVEDLDSMAGVSWYYQKFMRLREDEYALVRGDDGKYESINIVRHIATYGTIICMVFMILFAFIDLIISIGRLFSYTSRRIHVFPLLTVICGLGTVFLPMFLYAESLTSEALRTAFNDYFIIYWQDFIYGSDSQVAFSLFYALMLALPLIVTVLPLFFRNRVHKPITFVPRGNKPHTFPGQEYPTKAGQTIPTLFVNKTRKRSSLTPDNATSYNPYYYKQKY